MARPLGLVRVSCRVSIALVLCVTMAGTLSLWSLPAASLRDRVVRLTRAGCFRFDSPDAILHGHQETNPDAALSSLVVGHPQGAADPSVAPDAPHAARVTDSRTVGEPDPGASTAFGLPPLPASGASPPSARPPGRAPPLTA